MHVNCNAREKDRQRLERCGTTYPSPATDAADLRLIVHHVKRISAVTDGRAVGVDDAILYAIRLAARRLRDNYYPGGTLPGAA